MASILKSTLNTRFLPTGNMKYIRSDYPGNLTDDEVDWMQKNNITTIVDLREEKEYIAKPCRLENEKGFIYYHMPVTGGGDTPESPEAVAKVYLGMLDEQMDNIINTIMHAKSIDIKAEGLVNGEVSLNKGKTLQLTAVISPKNAVEKDVWWTSDDSNIATVSSKGLVNAVKAGDVNITVQSLNNPLIQAFVIVHVFDGDVDINNNPVDQVTAD